MPVSTIVSVNRSTNAKSAQSLVSVSQIATQTVSRIILTGFSMLQKVGHSPGTVFNQSFNVAQNQVARLTRVVNSNQISIQLTNVTRKIFVSKTINYTENMILTINKTINHIFGTIVQSTLVTFIGSETFIITFELIQKAGRTIFNLLETLTASQSQTATVLPRLVKPKNLSLTISQTVTQSRILGKIFTYAENILLNNTLINKTRLISLFILQNGFPPFETFGIKTISSISVNKAKQQVLLMQQNLNIRNIKQVVKSFFVQITINPIKISKIMITNLVFQTQNITLSKMRQGGAILFAIQNTSTNLYKSLSKIISTNVNQIASNNLLIQKIVVTIQTVVSYLVKYIPKTLSTTNTVLATKTAVGVITKAISTVQSITVSAFEKTLLKTINIIQSTFVNRSVNINSIKLIIINTFTNSKVTIPISLSAVQSSITVLNKIKIITLRTVQHIVLNFKAKTTNIIKKFAEGAHILKSTILSNPIIESAKMYKPRFFGRKDPK